MQSNRRIYRLPYRFALLLSSLALASIASVRAEEAELSQMSKNEIRSLQQRLADSGCFNGTADGIGSDALDAARVRCPSQTPSLRIETGAHVGPIWRITADASCHLVATASEDKTLRTWSMPNGKTDQVVRLPIGDGDEGKLYATALSPNGRWLAVGGHEARFETTSWLAVGGHEARFETTNRGSTQSITLIDLARDKRTRLGSFDDDINEIAFSSNNERLAVGYAHGLQVFDIAGGKKVYEDREYGGTIFGIRFFPEPDGGLVTTSIDGKIRRYDPNPSGVENDPKGCMPNYCRTAVVPAPDGRQQPYGVAIDPSGRRVALGYMDGVEVSILDAKTLERLHRAETGDIGPGHSTEDMTLQNVAWSTQGVLAAAGTAEIRKPNGDWGKIIRRFDSQGRKITPDVIARETRSDTITDIKPCGDGFVFADSGFGILDATGKAKPLPESRTADMRDKLGPAFAVSPDGSRVRFGLGFGAKNPVLFDVNAGRLLDEQIPDFITADVKSLPIKDWEENTKPKIAHVQESYAALGVADYEFSHALAIRPDAGGFALGTEWAVRAFDATGNIKKDWSPDPDPSGHAQGFVFGPGAARGLAFSGDGELLVVAYGDGTIRWLRWQDGKELLALFVEPETRKWVAWTPKGYYMASPGGEDLIGWQVNRGWEQKPDFFSASQFRTEYNRPDIVRLVLKLRDGAKAIEQANDASGAREATPIGDALPPVAQILSPSDGSQYSGDSVDIAYWVRSPAGVRIDRLQVLVDGQPALALAQTDPASEVGGKVTVELSRKNHVVSLVAYSRDLASKPDSVQLWYGGAAPKERPKKLYALLVGVTDYANYKTDLLFPARDAASLSEVIEKQKSINGGIYQDVETNVVTYPTRDNVIDGLYWLQKVAREDDVSLIFLSGHGATDSHQEFWFLTRDANFDRLMSTAIPNHDLFSIVTSIKGKKVLFIDACRAGAAVVPDNMYPDMNKVVADLSVVGSGVVVYGASTGTESALEADWYDRHGAFTKALIDAIDKGLAQVDSKGRITTSLLDAFLVERVRALTHGQQTPVMNRQLVPDFELVAVPH